MSEDSWGGPAFRANQCWQLNPLKRLDHRPKRSARWLETVPAGSGKTLAKIKRDLVYGEDTKPAEAALAELGRLLGLTASRPDNTKPKKTGPDVLWRHTHSMTGVALEAKQTKSLLRNTRRRMTSVSFMTMSSTWRRRIPETRSSKRSSVRRCRFPASAIPLMTFALSTWKNSRSSPNGCRQCITTWHRQPSETLSRFWRSAGFLSSVSNGHRASTRWRFRWRRTCSATKRRLTRWLEVPR